MRGYGISARSGKIDGGKTIETDRAVCSTGGVLRLVSPSLTHDDVHHPEDVDHLIERQRVKIGQKNDDDHRVAEKSALVIELWVAHNT